MEILGKWGAYLLVPQILLGGMMYVLTSFYVVDAIGLGLSIAGIVAVVYVIGGMIYNKPMCVVVSASSFAAMLTALSILAGSIFGSVSYGFFVFVLAYLAAALAQQERPSTRETFPVLILGALPGIWPAFFMCRLFFGK